ncbi:hypothetical protein H0H92_004966 [Tricholoma furcatifolium]|nr:hypothetical protein H0H92_004966 [Tricholoma furcatifolium]
MMQKDADLIRSKIGRVVCMGGALDVPGNTSPVAEYPFAVKELLKPQDPHLGLPLDRFVLLPLDITTPHELPFEDYIARIDPSFDSTLKPSVASDKAPLVHFTSAFLERTREVMLSFGKDAMELHDIVAVWCAIENPPGRELSPGWKVESRIFDVERYVQNMKRPATKFSTNVLLRTGEVTRGMLVVDRRQDESAYSPGANRSKAQAELERKIQHGSWDTSALEEDTRPEGIQCVTETPGPSVLLSYLFGRVWGAEAIDK